MEAQESTLSTTATGVRGEAARREQRHRHPSLRSHVPSLTRKMVMKTDFCQKILEGHTNAINFD